MQTVSFSTQSPDFNKHCWYAIMSWLAYIPILIFVLFTTYFVGAFDILPTCLTTYFCVRCLKSNNTDVIWLKLICNCPWKLFIVLAYWVQLAAFNDGTLWYLLVEQTITKSGVAVSSAPPWTTPFKTATHVSYADVRTTQTSVGATQSTPAGSFCPSALCIVVFCYLFVCTVFRDRS